MNIVSPNSSLRFPDIVSEHFRTVRCVTDRSKKEPHSLIVSHDLRTVARGGISQHLPNKALQAFILIAEHRGRVVSYEDLARHLYDSEDGPSFRNLIAAPICIARRTSLNIGYRLTNVPTIGYCAQLFPWSPMGIIPSPASLDIPDIARNDLTLFPEDGVVADGRAVEFLSRSTAGDAFAGFVGGDFVRWDGVTLRPAPKPQREILG